MKLTYLGTGAAEGIPSLFCQCDYCRRVRARGGRQIRSRSQLLVDGELSVDFPPDAFYHAARLKADLSAIRYLLVTHSHMDHFYAHDFILRGYKYAHGMTSPTLDIFGNAEVCEVFRECTRRELREEIAAGIRLHEIRAFEPFTFGEYRATALAASHTSREPFVYLIEKSGKKYLHLTDTGVLPEETFDYLSRVSGKAGAVTIDCTFLFDRADVVRRHMGLEDNARVLSRLKDFGLVDGETKVIITHFSHNSAPSPERLKRAEREYGVIAAYDGMTLEF